MCMRTTCGKCGKPTWGGCGRHVEQVLAGVPADQRCKCPRAAGSVLRPAGDASTDPPTDGFGSFAQFALTVGLAYGLYRWLSATPEPEMKTTYKWEGSEGSKWVPPSWPRPVVSGSWPAAGATPAKTGSRERYVVFDHNDNEIGPFDTRGEAEAYVKAKGIRSTDGESPVVPVRRAPPPSPATEFIVSTKGGDVPEVAAHGFADAKQKALALTQRLPKGDYAVVVAVRGGEQESVFRTRPAENINVGRWFSRGTP